MSFLFEGGLRHVHEQDFQERPKAGNGEDTFATEEKGRGLEPHQNLGGRRVRGCKPELEKRSRARDALDGEFVGRQ